MEIGFHFDCAVVLDVGLHIEELINRHIAFDEYFQFCSVFIEDYSIYELRVDLNTSNNCGDVVVVIFDDDEHVISPDEVIDSTNDRRSSG